MGGGLRNTTLSLGPLFAGIHIFSQIALFFSLGKFAAIIRDHWNEVTRKLWDLFFEHLAFLQISISDKEKDALTAIAFFLPLAISSVGIALWDKSHKSTKSESKKPSWSFLRSFAFRISSVFVAIAILAVVSKQVVADISAIIDGTEPDQHLVKFVSISSFIFLGFCGLLMVIVFIINPDNRRKIIAWGATGAGLFEILLIGTPVTLGVMVASSQLGPIRTAAVFLVTLSILLTAAIKPIRITQIAIVVLTLIAASACMELLEKIQSEFQYSSRVGFGPGGAYAKEYFCAQIIAR